MTLTRGNQNWTLSLLWTRTTRNTSVVRRTSLGKTSTTSAWCLPGDQDKNWWYWWTLLWWCHWRWRVAVGGEQALKMNLFPLASSWRKNDKFVDTKSANKLVIDFNLSANTAIFGVSNIRQSLRWFMSFCSTKNTNISTNQIMMEIALLTTYNLFTHKSRQISPTNISFSVFPKSWFIVFSIPDPPQNLELSKLDHNSVQMKVSLNSIKWNYKTSGTFIEYLFLTTIFDINWF